MALIQMICRNVELTAMIKKSTLLSGLYKKTSRSGISLRLNVTCEGKESPYTLRAKNAKELVDLIGLKLK